MLRRSACLLLFLTASAAAQQAFHPYPRISTPALALFEKDWVLMNWALKFYDRDRDILLSPQESGAAAAAFRRMADADHDGRVTVDEYRAARATILQRD